VNDIKPFIGIATAIVGIAILAVILWKQPGSTTSPATNVLMGFGNLMSNLLRSVTTAIPPATSISTPGGLGGMQVH